MEHNDKPKDKPEVRVYCVKYDWVVYPQSYEATHLANCDGDHHSWSPK